MKPPRPLTAADLVSAYSPIRRVETPESANMGKPVTFMSSQFAGKTMRTELTELQKADLGRKYAKKDRRALDPPPVVMLRVFEVFGLGTPQETEREVDYYDDIAGFGVVCHIDLFPVPDQEPQGKTGRRVRQPRHKAKLVDVAQLPTMGMPLSMVSSGAPPPLVADLYAALPSVPSTSPSATPTNSFLDFNSQLALSTPSMHTPRIPGPSISVYPQPASPGEFGPQAFFMQLQPQHPTIVAYKEDYPITEESKCTEALSGANFIQSASLDYNGKKVLMFIFADLAVRVEGSFILRYRVFNIFAKAYGTTDIPILTECYGGVFKVYASKEFPGLRASTDLTLSLSSYGVRLNLRENEPAKRQKKSVKAVQFSERSCIRSTKNTSSIGTRARKRKSKEISAGEEPEYDVQREDSSRFG